MATESLPKPHELEMAQSSSSSESTVLSDDLLRQVFIRLASPVTVVRAATVCKLWRRLITKPSFLHDFHLLHPSPPLLGFFVTPRANSLRSFIPSAQLDPELAARVDVTLSRLQLYPQGKWHVGDSLDTMFLFINSVDDKLAAYDHFSRHCTFFDPPPSSFFDTKTKDWRVIAKYMIASINRTSSQWFQVACIMENHGRMRAAVFSSDTEDWCLYPWSEMVMSTMSSYFWVGQLVNGFLYLWVSRLFMVVMDTRTMQFSVIDIKLPAYSDAIGETEDDELCIV